MKKAVNKSCYQFRTGQKIYLPFKRLIDIFGSLLGIIILGLPMIIIAIITRCTSKGPALFKQKRLGRYQKPFTLLKFRSMRVDAEQIGAEEMSVEKQQSMVTKWGKFMRRTSIDEFPQLFNIFVGQMSFIGPRPCMDQPELTEARNSFIPSAYEVKPGLSGYAQIHLKRNHDIDLKAKDDSTYVKRMSFSFDCKIFCYSLLVAFGLAKGR